ncbi:molybdopterin molybdochelatase [Draconibacterium orientale]|uniref:Molybdopterin molybdenumtransferase n=1 Tax=Draconibacterium orientale TaxID=1168034 RepID=X5E2D9_9BACT|nr:molybdopterin molybdotransferase MoeA [Draconibacterium orientale]AHW60751.1 molybdenum cofactor biosysnthesis protein MoeA [Draconibacterium orientale]SES71757.1 molybdopterin molybdochelatase [Draconibacterium orientale]
MNQFEKIQQLTGNLPPFFPTEKVQLENAFNRVLQEDVIADLNMPPFNKSAMDGYACRLEDIGNELEVLEVINAGKIASLKIGKNQCVKIMTGAAVPPECDCVFMVEDAEELHGNKVRCTNLNTMKNICYLGEDYKEGDVLLKKGALINVPQMAVLAGAGYTEVLVSKRPKATVIATGSELVSPSETPKPGQIRNSNSSQVITQLRKMNLEVVDELMLVDEYELLTKSFNKALESSDFIVFTGGASVGDFDFIPEILKEQGFKLYWDHTGIKPGNPMTFSEKEGKFVFGLSGNPVSSFVQFELIAKPVICKLLGSNYTPLRVKARMNFTYQRKKANRLAIIPVVIDSAGAISEIPFHGSAHINALAFANALLEVPLGVSTIQNNEFAYVRPL